ncbi:MAG: c-type cytochrome biogenesis protein CcmI [Lamprobacter sp.]|uniref:c-type cytochrome biogenesis protein CcmI n=1 Tax=Lamprobacter sp. TaxID=3100796 RepID=UPI002B260A91|nr:c-type cytochrome biogenesis protein CcmI [Lamprobacter sp.]MEA3639501.1 c-type cytochrome biogenesis protein CcmI [Lamprobacter sp.]
MTIFWILAAGLAGLAVLFAVAPLLVPAQPPRDGQDSNDPEAEQALLNLELFKQQLAELDADLSSGKLDQTLYEAARRDLERELLHDLGDRDPLTAARGLPPNQRRYRLPGPGLTALGLLLVVPLAAWALYGLIGNQAIIPQLEQLAASGGSGRGGHGGGQAELPPLEELIARLEQRLEQQPGNAEGWMMLGRTYFATGDRERAESALAQAYKLLPTDPLIVLAYAEAIATNNDNQLEGRPAELISEALELEPNNATARWLAAMVAFQRGQFQSAATTWGKLLEQVDPESEDAIELRNLISEAEQRAGLPAEARQLAQADRASAPSPSPAAAEAARQDGAQEQTPTEQASASAIQASHHAVQSPPARETGNAESTAALAANTAAASSANASAGADAAEATREAPNDGAQPGVQVSVALAAELSGRLPPNTPVFIYAKAAAGPPMPLAVQRATLGDLPVQVRLDDSMAMMPTMQLSNFPQIIVGARVSPSGQAMPRPGDLQGETGPINSTATTEPVQIRIDQMLR